MWAKWESGLMAVWLNRDPPVIKEEVAHQMQVSVLSQLHLQQAKEIKAQSEEINCFSTLLQRQQTILEKVQLQQSSVSQMSHTQPPPTRLEELHREAFKRPPSMVNTRCGAGIEHLYRLSQNILAVVEAFF